MRYGLLLGFALCACDSGHDPEAIARDKGAMVTALGIPVKFAQDFAGDKDAALAYVDARAAEWVSEKTLWWCSSYTDEELYAIARTEYVVLHGTKFVATDTPGQYYGYNTLGYCIDVIYDGDHSAMPCEYDPPEVASQYATDIRPLYHIKHEFTHTALGAWHP